jgi:hypothetical protein
MNTQDKKKITINFIITTADILECNNNPQVAIIKHINKECKESIFGISIDNLIDIEYINGLRSPFDNNIPLNINSTLDGFKVICTFEIEEDKIDKSLFNKIV